MSRILAPASKIARNLGSSSSASSHIAQHASKAAAGSMPLSKHDLKADGRSTEHSDHARSMTTSTPHRPVPSPHRVVPLMQTFRSSAPAPARSDASHIDYFVMPTTESLYGEPQDGSFAATMRMPLLPDTVIPDRSALEGHAPEAADAPLAVPEILVVAANPENVLPAALTEVEGIGADGLELRFVHEPEDPAGPEQGMLTDIWKGLMDDVFGADKTATAVKTV